MSSNVSRWKILNCPLSKLSSSRSSRIDRIQIWSKIKTKFYYKLDRIAQLIPDPRSNSSTTFSMFFKGTLGGRRIFSTNCRSLALTVWEWMCFEDFEEKDHWLSQSVNDDGVCRTAPASPGHLILSQDYEKKTYIFVKNSNWNHIFMTRKSTQQLLIGVITNVYQTEYC